MEIHVLEGLGSFEMCSHVKNRFLIKSNTFANFRVQEVVSVSEISAVNLIVCL